MKNSSMLYDKLHKVESEHKKEDYKKVYLILYNLFQFIGFLYVAVMAVRYIALEESSIEDEYKRIAPPMKIVQLMQYLEVMHPMFGFTKGGVLVPFLQVSSRVLVLFANIEAEPRIQTTPVVFYLFIVWSIVEIVRYSFYITQVYKKEVYILTWLRYTMWIPLYPMGVACEVIVLIRNISYFEETHRYTIFMPNAWNFIFHMPNAMRVYLLIVMGPGLYFLMSHMYTLRAIKLKPKVK